MELVREQPLSRVNGGTIDVERMTQEVLRRLARRLEETNGRLYEIEVPIGISVRHCHLSPEDVETLFGEGHSLNVYNELYQKGYFAAAEQLMVVGKRRCIEKVRVLGPTRTPSQVELAQTEAHALGMKLPLAISGKDPAVVPITLVGPEGVVMLPGHGQGGAFIMRRHVHLNPEVAGRIGVKDGDLLDLRITGPRDATLHGVVVRIKEGWRPEVHLDTDEGNAVAIRSGQSGILVVPEALR
jgi:putative phosphotransacetylase